MKIDKIALSSAIAKDLAKNRATRIAVIELGNRSKKDVIDFILADILRGVRRKGPAAFPRVQAVFRRVIDAEKKRGEMVHSRSNGIGQTEDKIIATFGIPATTPEVKEEKPKPTDWGAIIGSALGSIVTAGAAIYTTRKTLQFQEDQLKVQERLAQQELAAAEAEAEAAAMIARMRQQQAVLSTAGAQQHAATVIAAGGVVGISAEEGIPTWMLVGGAATVGLLIFLATR